MTLKACLIQQAHSALNAASCNENLV